MSFESQVAELSFETDGVTTAFPLSNGGGALFFMAGADIRAWYQPAAGAGVQLVSGTDFAISGDGRAGTGVLTTTIARGAGSLRIWCATPLVQPEEYGEGDGFPAKTHERAVDRHVMQSRDLARQVSRAIRAPDSEAPGNFVVPAIADRKGKLLGFDAVTGLPSTSLPDAASMLAAAATAQTAITNFNILIGTYGTPFRTGPNFFDLLTPTEIATVKAGENATNLMAKIQAAMTLYPNTEWEAAAGWFFLDGLAALSLPEGITWIGRGIGKTVFKIGNTPWGIEQLNANGLEKREAFCARGIEFLFSSNGVRLNSTAGGYDDTVATQRYIMRPRFERCHFKQNSVTAGLIGLQWNKCFSGVLDGVLFDGFAVQFNAEGSDMVEVTGASRFDNASDGAILAMAHNPFGTNLVIHAATDINNPKNYGVRSNYRKIVIRDIHGELDFLPGSTGTGGKMEAFIDITSGSGAAFHTTIENNLLPVGTWSDKWLRYRSNNPYSLYVVDNNAPGAMGAVDIGSQPYFTNSGTRMLCVHHGNGEGDNSFPMNSEPTDAPLGGDAAFLLSASRPGVSSAVGLGAIVGGVRCQDGDFILVPDANTAHVIEFSDWSGYPANNLIGTFTAKSLTYANVAGQVLSWELRDGASVISSGTITHAVANQLYKTTIFTSQAFATTVKLRVWNADTGHGGNDYVRTIKGDIG